MVMKRMKEYVSNMDDDSPGTPNPIQGGPTSSQDPHKLSGGASAENKSNCLC